MTAGADWRHQARCRDEDPEVFFDPACVAEAKAVCRGCPVRAQCLAWALDTKPIEGVHGGELFDRGRPVWSGARHTGKGICQVCRGPAATKQSRYCGDHRPGADSATRPIDHGTEAGAQTHRRRGARPCPACLAAETLAADGRRSIDPCERGCGRPASGSNARYCAPCRADVRARQVHAQNLARRTAA